MEQIPEQQPKPEGQPSVDVEQKAKDYIQSLKDRPKPVPVDYTKPRPIQRPQESQEQVVDKKLHAEAYRMSREDGEKRTTYQILQDLRAQEKAEKEKGNK